MNIPEAEFTTNEEDQREAAKLKDRLNDQTRKRGAPTIRGNLPVVPHVTIDDGAHKYVLIEAERSGDLEYFVTSRRGAAYHRNAAKPLIEQLESAGYVDIRVTGGGRIFWDEAKKAISIFGYSYSFGQGEFQSCRINFSSKVSEGKSSVAGGLLTSRNLGPVS